MQVLAEEITHREHNGSIWDLVQHHGHRTSVRGKSHAEWYEVVILWSGRPGMVIAMLLLILPDSAIFIFIHYIAWISIEALNIIMDLSTMYSIFLMQII